MNDTSVQPVSANGRQTMTVLLIVLALLAVTCLASIMFAFMGGSAAAIDAASLNNLQALGIVLSLLVTIVSIRWFYRSSETPWNLLWLHLPGWLFFIIIILNLLVLSGEVSYYLLFSRDVIIESWQNHVALLCLGFASVGFGLLFAMRNARLGRPPFDKSRW